jgi:hypothetical protein
MLKLYSIIKVVLTFLYNFTQNSNCLTPREMKIIFPYGDNNI